MNKKVIKLTNILYKTYEPVIKEHGSKILDEWNSLFLHLETTKEKEELYSALNDIFMFGARYIRESNHYRTFRFVYHSLFDEIGAIKDE